jgi:hypothetical protein
MSSQIKPSEEAMEAADKLICGRIVFARLSQEEFARALDAFSAERVAAERESCAKLAASYVPPTVQAMSQTSTRIAAAIRARGGNGGWTHVDA